MQSTAVRAGSSSFAPSHGSRTLTVTDSQPSEDRPGSRTGAEGSEDERSSDVVGRLVLRGGPRSRPRVAWREGVIDNESMGRKKSKVCCIYHKPRNFDESSSSDSSDSDSNSDSSHSRARPARRRHHHHDHNHDCDHSHDTESSAGGATRDGGGTVTELKDVDPASEPNAYEKMPKPRKGKGKAKPCA